MVKTIQIGDVFGDVQEVRLEDNQTLLDALQQVNMSIGSSQQLIANSNSQSVNVTDSPVDNEVYLLTSNQTSG